MAYLLLFVTFALSILGVLVKTAKDGNSGSSENKLTIGGWTVLGLLVISCGLSLAVQYESDEENQDLKDSLHQTSTTLRMISIKNDTIHRLQRILTRATEAIDTSTQILKQMSKENTQLSKQIMEEQAEEIVRAKRDNADLRERLGDQKRRMQQLSRPIRISRLNYTITIAGDQLSVQTYRDRLLREGLTFDEQYNLVRSGYLPDAKQLGEEEILEFLKVLDCEIVFGSTGVYLPRNSLALRTVDNIYRQNRNTTKCSLKFDASSRRFILSVETSNLTEENRGDMVGLIDFTDKYVFFELVNGLPSVQYSLTKLVLSNIDGRSLEIVGFQQIVSRDGQKRFRAKINEATFF